MRFGIVAGLVPIMLLAQGGMGGAGSSANRAESQRRPAMTAEPVAAEDRCSIEGTVLNSATGEPLRKATLVLRRITESPSAVPGESLYSANSDAAGRFQITGVQPGSYRLSADRSGFVAQQYTGARSGGSATMITVGKAQHLKDINFRMTPQGVITGRVLDEDGDPVQNVAVNCLRRAYVRGRKQWVPVNGQTTNDLGEYRVHSLAPGRYALSATHRSGFMDMGVQGPGADEGYAPTYYPNAASPDLASVLEITPGVQLRNIDLQLRKVRTTRIRGRVLSGVSGKPVRNAMIMAEAQSDSIMDLIPRSGRVMDQNGGFVISGVAPGSYWLTVDASEENARIHSRIPIEVGNSGVDNLVLTAAPGVDLTGSVKAAPGTEIKVGGVRIQLEAKRIGRSYTGFSGGSTSEDGTFTLKGVFPQSYFVRVIGLPETLYVKSIQFGDADITDSGLDFSAGVTPAQFVITVTAGAGQIDGLVKSEKSPAAATATVVLIPEDAAKRESQQHYRSTTTDQEGKFSFKGLTPGEYRVYAFDEIESGAYMDPDFMKPFESKGDRIKLRESGRESIQPTLIETAPRS